VFIDRRARREAFARARRKETVAQRNVVARTWPPIGAVIVSTAALLFAAPAAADATDDAFVAALEKRGIFFRSRSAALTLGHNVCAGLDKGQTPAAAVMSVVTATNLSARQAGFFVGASVSAYCPQHKGDTGISTLSPGA
jgi:hypothetical protein